jgi:putative transposase
VPKRKRRKGIAMKRQTLVLPEAPNQTWPMDFVMDSLACGRRIKCLTIVDDFTKERLDIPMANGYLWQPGCLHSGCHSSL